MEKRIGLTLVAAFFLLGAAGSGNWKTLYLRDDVGHLYRASSELQAPADNSFGRYGMHRVFDGNSATCWAEGAADAGIGTTLYLAVPAATPSLSIANGYQKSRSLYRANNRVKTVKLALLVGINREGEASELFTVYHAQKFPFENTVSLQDTFGYQQVPLAFDWQRVQAFKNKVLAEFKSRQKKADTSLKLDTRCILRLTIVDVFKGARYDDTCISEIMLNTPAASAYPVVKKIYVNPEENTIYMDSPTVTGIILDRDPKAVFQLIDTSAKRQWVIAIRMPAETGDSRVETTYVLYNTRLKRRVPAEIMGPEVGEMVDFDQSDGTTYLNYLNNKTGEIERLDLNELYRRLAGSN